MAFEIENSIDDSEFNGLRNMRYLTMDQLCLRRLTKVICRFGQTGHTPGPVFSSALVIVWTGLLIEIFLAIDIADKPKALAPHQVGKIRIIRPPFASFQ